MVVYARTAPDDPFTLSIEGPGTLDGLIGDGAPSDDATCRNGGCSYS